MDFHYTLSDLTPDQTTPNVMSVTFDIGRYGELIQTIIFDHLFTETEAIEAAERWLSQPMTQEGLDHLKEEEDLFCGGSDTSLDDFPNKGGALGDAIYLEYIDRNGEHITLVCGS